jgi:hypothetical protein
MTSLSIVWLFKDSEGYEDYAQSEEERDQLHAIYQQAGTSYSVTELIRGEDQ